MTFHKDADKSFFKQNSAPVAGDHDPSSFQAAMMLVHQGDVMFPLGLIFEATDGQPTYGERIDSLIVGKPDARHAVEGIIATYR